MSKEVKKFIENVTVGEKSTIKNKTAHGLPDRPSYTGMKAADIKAAFWTPIIDDTAGRGHSVISVIERIVNEANEILKSLYTVAEATARSDDERHEQLSDSVSEIDENILSIGKSIEDINADILSINSSLEKKLSIKKPGKYAAYTVLSDGSSKMTPIALSPGGRTLVERLEDGYVRVVAPDKKTYNDDVEKSYAINQGYADDKYLSIKEPEDNSVYAVMTPQSTGIPKQTMIKFISRGTAKDTIAFRDDQGRLWAKAPDGNEDSHVVNYGFLISALERIKKEILTGETGGTIAQAYDTIKEIADWIAGSEGSGAADLVSKTIFGENLSVTVPIGSVTQEMINDNNGVYKLDTNGKCVGDVLKMLLCPDIDPKITFPELVLTVSGSDSEGEVGSTFALPKATLKVSVAEYEYGAVDNAGKKYDAIDTGVKYKANAIVLSQSGGDSVSNSSDYTNKEVTLILHATGDNEYRDGISQFTFNASGSYENETDRLPITLLGNKAEALKILRATFTARQVKRTFTGLRRVFCGTLNSDQSLDSDTIRSCATNSEFAQPGTKYFTAPEGCSLVYIAIPQRYSTDAPTVLYEENGTYQPFANRFQLKQTVNIIGAAERTETPYNIYTWVPADEHLEAETKFSITI